MKTSPAITIHYCSQCNWLLRAGWMAQELLHTFSTDLASVSKIDGQLIWDRKTDGGFPEAKELKQRVRNYCFPERELGHIDKK